MTTSFERLRREADACLSRGPYSVTDKPLLKFSRDPHYYVSGRLYWWEVNGRYVRRDGRVNPITQSDLFDRKRLGQFVHSVTTLSLAAELIGDAIYWEYASRLVRVWFLDPATRMLPSLRYAQVVPGHPTNGLGIIDTYDFWVLPACFGVLQRHGALSPNELRALQDWFGRLASWMKWSLLGWRERRRKNNHGTSFDVQLASYLLFCGKEAAARRLVRTSRGRRVERQIASDGHQPLEMNRSRSLHYHYYNLQKLLHLAELGSRCGVDILHFRGRIHAALTFLAVYADGSAQWTGTEIDDVCQEMVDEVVVVGARALGIPAYVTMLDTRVALDSYARTLPVLHYPNMLGNVMDR